MTKELHDFLLDLNDDAKQKFSLPVEDTKYFFGQCAIARSIIEAIPECSYLSAKEHLFTLLIQDRERTADFRFFIIYFLVYKSDEFLTHFVKKGLIKNEKSKSH